MCRVYVRMQGQQHAEKQGPLQLQRLDSHLFAISEGDNAERWLVVRLEQSPALCAAGERLSAISGQRGKVQR
jgi:hypothetical protein